MIRKLLIVEDTAGATEALAEFLRQQAYEVEAAPDFPTAYCLAETTPPDLIIVDISKFGGTRVINARTLGWIMASPVVILTDQPSIQLGDALTGLPPIDSVIFKPCSNLTVLHAVQEAEESLSLKRMSLSLP